MAGAQTGVASTAVAVTTPSNPTVTSTVSNPSSKPTQTPVPQNVTTSNLALSAPATVSVGSTAEVDVQLTGSASDIAAFNFDLVYDQRVVSLSAPTPNLSALNVSGRDFQCNLPAASGDIDFRSQHRTGEDLLL